MNNETTVCFQSRGALVEIDNYGERLIGSVECNRWTKSQLTALTIVGEGPLRVGVHFRFRFSKRIIARAAMT